MTSMATAAINEYEKTPQGYVVFHIEVFVDFEFREKEIPQADDFGLCSQYQRLEPLECT